MGVSFIEKYLNGINLANEFCCALFTMVVLVALILKKNDNKEIRSFIYFCFCSTAAMWTDVICYLAAGNSKFILLMYTMTVISYTFTSFAMCMFYMYVMDYFSVRNKINFNPLLRLSAYIYTSVCSILYLTSAWTGQFFTIDNDAKFHASPNASIIGAIQIPIVAASIIVLIKYRKLSSKRDTIIHLSYNVLNIFFGYIDTQYTVSFHYIVMTILVFVIFIFIGMERDKELEMKGRELAISELNALRLQMNPHFVYNTLASIDGLVVLEPDSARELISKFTKHLRSSYLDNSPEYVPFSKELENIKCYLSVEEVRFPNIKFVVDLDSIDFNIPPLTVQPIVENAVKHGICKRKNSAGTISIKSYEDNSNYYVKIIDDGVGFDTSVKKADDSRSHIGIENTRKRLELICNGTLKLTSIEGVGTEAIISIPKEKV